MTNGGKQAVYQAFATILDPGDEVLLPAPYWTTYPEAIRLAGGVPVEVFAGADQDYLVTVEQLEAARTEHTKVLLFVSPSNPTGAVYSPEHTTAIGEWAEHHGLWVIATRSTRTSSTAMDRTRSRDVHRRGRARARRPHDPGQRRRQDLLDDRMARGLDGRARGRRRRPPATCSRTSRATCPTSRSAPRSRRSPDRRMPWSRCASRSNAAAETIVAELNEHPRRALPDPAGAFYVYPDVHRTARARLGRGHADHVARARRPHPRPGRGRGRARRGLRPERLPAALVRARRRGAARGRASACRRSSRDRGRARRARRARPRALPHRRDRCAERVRAAAGTAA